jgi:chromosome segregation ATPase
MGAIKTRRFFMGALGRIFRNIWYAITGKGNRAADRMAANPDVISGTYDHIVAEKRGRINQFKDAISGLVAIQEKKKDSLETESNEVARLEKLKAGALASAQKVAQTYNGDQTKTMADADYQKHQAAFRDFSSTLDAKKKHVAELEGDIQGQQKTINDYTVQIQTQMRDLEKIASEKQETIADVMSANEQKQVADLVSGLSQDNTAQDLQNMRDMRQKAKASAKVSQTLSGMDTRTAEAEYEKAAGNTEADDEFAKLMNFKTPDAPAATAPTPVPEH